MDLLHTEIPRQARDDNQYNEALRANASAIASQATAEARSFSAESGVAPTLQEVGAFIPRTKSPGSSAKTDKPEKSGD